MPRGQRGKESDTDVPSTLERSDAHARDIYTSAHDSAVESYGEGEHVHRVAYAALKHSYKKVGDHWEAKAERGPSDEQAARGPATRIKSTDSRTARTKGGAVDTEGKSKAELMQEARRLKVSGRSSMDKEELSQAVREARHHEGGR